MGGKIDMVKGRIKEAVGALVDNNKLRQEGKDAQAVGKIKQAAETAVATAKDIAHKSVLAAKETSRHAVNVAKVFARKSVDQVKEAAKPICR